MASNVVRVSLLADARGWKKGMGEAETATTNFEKKAGAVGKAITGFFALQATQAVVSFAKDSIRAFSELEQATGSVESVFGDAAGTIIEMSREAADEFGLSASEFQSSAALIGSQLKNQLGLSADEAAGKVEELLGRAADMASTFGGSTSDAVAAIGSLLRGETESIEKYGVSMNQAAIEAHALEMGLVGANQEMTPQIKAASALDLMLQQTSDSAGQFADESETVAGKMQRQTAEMEDQKALLGQSLVPLYGTWLDIMKKMTPEVGNIALGLAEITGAMSSSETAIAEWEQKTGRAAETAADFLDAITEDVNIGAVGELFGVVATQTDEFTNNVLDGIDTWSLGAEELQLLRDTLYVLYNQEKITKEQLDVLIPVIDRKTEAIQQANRETERGRGREEEYAAALRGERDAQVGAKDATYDHLGAIQELRDEQRAQIDPIFAYAEAQRDVADAQVEVTEAAKEFGEGSPEHLAALDALREAGYDVQDAEMAMAEGMGTSREDMETHLRSLRIYTEQQIQLILDDMDRINAFRFRAKTIEITHRVTGGGYQRQHGGPVMPHTPYLVGERGPEVFEPSTGGRVIPNQAIGGHTGGGGGAVVNITINAGLGSDPNAISRAVVEALQRYQRHNGAIPIRVV